MNIVLIDKSNFGYGSMDSFSRYQVVENVYRLIDGSLQLVHHPFTENWSLERKREKAKEILNGKHTVYGAFENGCVIGIIMLLPELDRNRMIIDSFHVSSDKRRQGYGRALFEAAKTEARERGAAALYVSACSAQETIDFYMDMGFRVSLHPIQSCVDDEPWDIQMECVL